MISDPVLNPLTGKWMLYLARPIVDDKEGFAGLALVGVPTSYFEGYFSTIDMGPESAVSLSNHALKLIARWPRIDSLIGKPLPNYIPELERDPDGKTLAVLEGADGLDRLIAITRFDVQGQQLFLGVAQTWGAILQPWRDSLVWVVLFALLSLMVLIALTWFVFRAVNSERRWTRALIERETRLIKQARELSRARDAAEGANKVRAQFLANMSHELRTPLNAVLGFTEIIDQEMLGPIGAGYKEFTQDILASGRRLLEIINNILDLTRLDAGTLVLEEQEVDIGDIMRLSARLCEEPAEKAGLTLNASRPAQEIMMMGDPLRLKQILLNVLTNAITFTPAGGRITFSGSLVEEGFLIQIADTGIGMTEEEAARAMQRFGQVDGSLARQHEGAGLGLPIAKSLAELHGGRLTMKSAPGQGTIVTLLLPKRRLIQSQSNSAEQAAGSQAMPTGFARAI
jgi:signal transduction histidine kinase